MKLYPIDWFSRKNKNTKLNTSNNSNKLQFIPNKNNEQLKLLIEFGMEIQRHEIILTKDQMKNKAKQFLINNENS